MLRRLWQRCSLDPRRSSFLPLHRRENTRVHTCMRARHIRISPRSLQTSKQNRVYLPLCPQHARLRVAFSYVINDRFSQTHRVSSSLLVHEPKGISAPGEIATVDVRVTFREQGPSTRATNVSKIVPVAVCTNARSYASWQTTFEFKRHRADADS